MRSPVEWERRRKRSGAVRCEMDAAGACLVLGDGWQHSKLAMMLPRD
jgi:hypothetical protein